MFSLSPSKINNYLQCPFKYKCYIDTELRKKFKRETAPLIFGNLIHSCLNDLYKRTEKDKRNLQRLRELFEIKFKANLEKYKRIFKTKENIIQYVEEAKKMFDNFIKSRLFNKEPFITEEFHRYLLRENLEISGKFDRVDLENNELTLIDYKTGKLIEDESNEFQLDFYESLLTKIRPEYQVREKILYFLKENKIIRYKANKKNLVRTEEKILNIADTIRNDTEFTPTLNNKCIYCEYRSICSAMSENIY